jgi:hypothetical protein
MSARGEVVALGRRRNLPVGGSRQALGTVFEEAVPNLLGGAKPVSRPLPDPAISPAGAVPGWPDTRVRQAGPTRTRAGRDGLEET